MRESLGWITNCRNAEQCPQNWLELSVSEVPTQVSCHVCGQTVVLVTDEAEFQRASDRDVSAWPVVAPIGLGQVPEVDVADGLSRPPESEPEAPALPRTAAAGPRTSRREEAMKTWFVLLDSGERLQVDKDHMVIGRSRTCDIILPSAKVSRQHATVSRVDGELYIEDLGSANGVWKNGQRIERDKIAPGDIIVVSDETLRFEVQ